MKVYVVDNWELRQADRNRGERLGGWLLVETEDDTFWGRVERGMCAAT